MTRRGVGIVLLCGGLGLGMLGGARRLSADDDTSVPRRPNIVILLAGKHPEKHRELAAQWERLTREMVAHEGNGPGASD